MFASYVRAKYIWFNMVTTNSNLGLTSCMKKRGLTSTAEHNCDFIPQGYVWMEEFGEGKGGMIFQF